MANEKVFSLKLIEVRVGADLQFSGSLLQICEGIINELCLSMFSLGTESRPVPDDLRGLDGS